jgi:hypothetical protein
MLSPIVVRPFVELLSEMMVRVDVIKNANLDRIILFQKERRNDIIFFSSNNE